MTNEEKNFDNFLVSTFNQKQFEQKAEYWENAQKMIASHRSNSVKEYTSVILSVAVIAALSIGMLWNSAFTKAGANNYKNETAVNQQANISNQLNTLEISKNTNQIENKAVIIKTEPNTIDSKTDNETISKSNVLANEVKKQPSNQVNKPLFAGKKERKPKSSASLNNQSNKNNNLVKALKDNELYSAIKPNPKLNPSEISTQNTIQYLRVKNSTHPLEKQTSYLPYNKQERKNMVMFEAGINSYNTILSNRSLGLNAGLRYIHFISSKTALTVGLGWSRINQNIDSRDYTKIDYSFGQQNNTVQIQTLSLDYIDIPLGILVNLKGHHYLTGGLNLAYAIQSKDEVTNQNNSQIGKGYLDAINSFDLQPTIGYTYLLNQRYSFAAAYYIGLKDVSNDEVFNNKTINRNQGLRLTLGYKIR